MNFNTFYNKILTDENMVETIRHSSSAYPFQFYYDNLALFDFHALNGIGMLNLNLYMWKRELLCFVWAKSKLRLKRDKVYL